MKRYKYTLLFILCLISIAVLHAGNLTVSGIPSPADANGTYIPNGTLYGYPSWKHETKNYFIYYEEYGSGGDYYYWNIDNNTDINDGEYLYSETNAPGDSPVNVVCWYDNNDPNGWTTIPIYISEDCTTPDINVRGEINARGDNPSIVSGNLSYTFDNCTRFGSAVVSSGTKTRTFTIQNTGSSALLISGISFSGENPSDFTVTAAPAASVAANSFTTFTVTFSPTAIGNRTAVVSINNNDPNEDPYTFAIQGYGFTPRNLVVSGITTPAAANGTYTYQGLSNGHESWKHQTLNYYIYNFTVAHSNTHRWNIDDDNNSDNNSLFYNYINESSPVGLVWSAYSGTTTSTGVFVKEVSIKPKIDILGSDKYVIYNGDANPGLPDGSNFSSLESSSGSVTATFKIRNRGNAVLNLTDTSPYINITGPGASDFSVTGIPTASLNADDSVTFQITFTPSSEGTKNAFVSIASNDNDNNNFTFAIKGTGTASRNLAVSNITTPAAANGTYIYQGILDNFQYWKHSSGSYYIYNYKLTSSTNRFWAIDNDLDQVTVNFRSNTENDEAYPNNVKCWGARTGNVGAPIIQFAGPDIKLIGNSIEIIDGDNSPSSLDHTDFGTTSGTITRTFTIQNTGTAALNLTGASPYIQFTGDASADFSVTAIPSSSIAASGSTTFQVTFNPTAAGTRLANLVIANNDPDENPYNFPVKGTGIIEVSFTDGSAFAQDINANSANQVIGRFCLTGNGTGTTLTGISIKLNGTRTGLSNLKLWSSTDAAFDAGTDTQIGSTVAADPGDGNSVSFNGISGLISTSGTYYFLTGDVAVGGDGTVQGIIVNNSSVSFSSDASFISTITNAALSNNTDPLPVELTSFAACKVNKGIELKWQTATEENNYGFEIERNTPLNPLSRGDNAENPLSSLPTGQAGGDERGVWEKIGFVHGAGNSSSPKDYSFIDSSIYAQTGIIQYRLKQIDLDGNYKYYSQTAEVNFSMTDVKKNLIPTEFGLSQNYPNPFNPSTVISYQLPVNGNVVLKVYDMLGNEVSTLVNETKAPGYYNVTFNAGNLSTGVYIYRITAGNFTSTKKLMLMK